MSAFDPHRVPRFGDGVGGASGASAARASQQQVINQQVETNAKQQFQSTTSGHTTLQQQQPSSIRSNSHSQLKMSSALARQAAGLLPAPIPPASKRARAKQRKWRVLVSIALLLPALAAIIGIVAWTISIEVTNSEQRHLNGHQRHSFHLHQQRHHWSNQQPQQQLSNNHLQQQRSKQQTEAFAENPMPQAQPIQFRPEATMTARRTARAQQQLQAQSTLEPEEATQAEPAKRRPQSKETDVEKTPTATKRNKEDRQQALLLRNLNQLDSLSGQSAELDSHPVPLPSRSDSPTQDAESGESGPTDSPLLSAGNEDNSDASNDQREPESAEGQNLANDAPTTNLNDANDEAEAPPAEREEGGEKRATIDEAPDKQQRHKSRWLNYDASSAAERQQAGNRKKRPAVVLPSKTRDSRPEFKATTTEAKARKARVHSATAAGSTKQLQNNKYTLTVDSETQQPSRAAVEPADAADAAAPAKVSEQASEPITRNDEDISFEQIASAISSTLSREAAATAGEDSQQPQQQQQTAPRRRTTGEHVAEVIDHLVDRRKQATEQDEQRRANSQLGPQVVVVAPVGANMKARSLTKELGAGEQSRPTEAAKHQQRQAPKVEQGRRTLLGARLLGTGLSGAETALGKQAERFSERVEVIEADDSSSLLMAPRLGGLKAAAASDEERQEDDEGREQNEQQRRAAEVEMLFPSSSHVSQDATEPRLRSPRHFKQAGELERFPSSQQLRPIQVVLPLAAQMAPQLRPQQQLAQAKLYSAEQLIREHVLKSKLRHNSEQPAPQASQPQPPAQQPQQSKQQQQVTGAPSSTTAAPESSSTTSTTGKPREQATDGGQQQVAQVPKHQQSRQQQQQPEVPVQTQQQQFASSFQPVQVPAFFIGGAPAGQREMFHSMESQQIHQQQLDPVQQEQAQFQLPIFQDQEIQVPAHMAESVIQDLQRSASQVTGYLNGRPATFQAIPGDQMMAPLQTQAQRPMQVPHGSAMMAAVASQRQARFVRPAQFGGQFSVPRQFGPPAASASGRFEPAARREQEQLQQQQTSKTPGAHQARKSLLSKALNPHSLVQPMMQRAFGGLLSSLSQQAAEQQAQLDAAESAQAGDRSLKEQTKTGALVEGEPSKQLAGGAPSDPMQAAASALVPNQVRADQAQGAPSMGAEQELSAATAAASRSMRSLPIGAHAPASQQQALMVADQEASESSYGPPMGPGYHHMGGGGGGAYHPQPNYQSEHDKKTKGITFHFGGGPIGGGTQLITSPMGIFKHLMIPLLPNPRVNLNGKVVFGVVLEKTTAFGPPPKKYKFWG